MKNLKRKITTFATAMLLSLGVASPLTAMQGTEKFNLKPAEEITEETRFPYVVYETNSRMRQLCYQVEDEKQETERVFYGVTTNEQFGLAVALYEDKNRKKDEPYNYRLIANFKDVKSWLDDESVDYIAYDSIEIEFEREEFVKRLEHLYSDNRNIGNSRIFSIPIVDSSKLSEEEKKNISDTLYFGMRYKNKETGKMEDLVYVIKLEGNKDSGLLLKGYGNGHITLQDTDGDVLWH